MAKRRLVELVLQGKDETKAAFTSADKSLKGLGGSADGTAKSFGGLNVSSLKAAAGVAAVGAAVVAAGKQLYSFVSDMAATGDELEKLGQRTGFAVEQLSEFRFLVERSGGSAGDMETAVRRLAQSMGDARDGVKEASDAFARLGLSADDLVGADGMLRSIDEVLPLIADGLQSVQSQADRIDIAQALLGRGGTKLLPALQEGADGIREMREEMEKYGGAMSQGFADKSAEFVDAQTNLKTAASRLKEAVSEPFLGPFTAAVNKLAEAMAGSKSVWDKLGELDKKEKDDRERLREELRRKAYEAEYGPEPGLADDGRPGLIAPGQPGYLDGLAVPQIEDMPWYIDPPAGYSEAPSADLENIDIQKLPINMEATLGPQDYRVYGGTADLFEQSPEERFQDLIEAANAAADEAFQAYLEGAEGFDAQMESIGENFASGFSSGVGQAFAQAIVYAEDFGDVMGGIFKQLMAQLIQQVVAAGLNSIFPGLGLIAGGLKSADGGAVASDETKGGLPPNALADIGRTNYYATATYAKGYV